MTFALATFPRLTRDGQRDSRALDDYLAEYTRPELTEDEVHVPVVKLEALLRPIVSGEIGPFLAGYAHADGWVYAGPVADYHAVRFVRADFPEIS